MKAIAQTSKDVQLATQASLRLKLKLCNDAHKIKNTSIRTHCIFSCKHFLNRLICATLCHYSTKRPHGVNILLFRLISPPKFVPWDLTNIIFRCPFLYSVRWCKWLSKQECYVNFHMLYLIFHDTWKAIPDQILHIELLWCKGGNNKQQYQWYKPEQRRIQQRTHQMPERLCKACKVSHTETCLTYKKCDEYEIKKLLKLRNTGTSKVEVHPG